MTTERKPNGFTLARKLVQQAILAGARLRSNHGLEHAVLHVLSRRFPQRRFAGHSSQSGFRIIGDISREEFEDALQDALERLRKGEKALAVHQNCGTNYVTAGTLAGLAVSASWLGVGKTLKARAERLPLAIASAVLAVMVGFPLGIYAQKRFTTSGLVENLTIKEIKSNPKGKLTVFQVVT